MTASVRVGLVVLLCGVLGACSGTTREECVSHYDPVVGASTWPGLKRAILAEAQWGRVAAVRTQASGVDVGAGDQDAVRVVDLLDGSGRRLAQADVWRTDQGAWRAGVWNQCTD